MGYPFSIFGTIIYFVYLVIVLGAIVVPVYLLFKNKSWKWFVITPIAIVLIAAPVAEELWIQYHYDSLCKDAGIHVKKRVKVDGYYNATKNDSSTKNEIYKDPKAVERLKNSGFLYIERRTREGKVRHLEAKDKEMIVQTILDKPQAQYYLLHTDNHTLVGHKLTKMERIIIDSQNNEEISRDTKYARYPGLIESLWLRYIGSGMNICYGTHPGKSKIRKTLMSYTFIPVNSKQDVVK